MNFQVVVGDFDVGGGVDIVGIGVSSDDTNISNGYILPP